ncbi:hypothetical protein Asru_0053_05 [Acidisphaera rubrifaciens HS-AP3]|uniref:Uncharacterized protein n=1 Tax=Acidisphaera rubrifaciens HS-AP3 TaxID=1231350 RepID=A0A0D6P2Z5_9PROT|nr:hypothetical protein Asru_0053_05 [Acidisphaera rubrifaciens HS-AP3]
MTMTQVTRTAGPACISAMRVVGCAGAPHPKQAEEHGRRDEAGAVIPPPVPAFYARSRTLEDMVDHAVARLLNLFDLTCPASHAVASPPRTSPRRTRRRSRSGWGGGGRKPCSRSYRLPTSPTIVSMAKGPADLGKYGNK